MSLSKKMSVNRAANRSVGILGEEAALKFFKSDGYRVLERNYRVSCGEIDLILEKERELVFVEVKARRSSRYGLPQEAVVSTKQQRIMRAAQWYVQNKRLYDRVMRFDVLAVMFKEGGGYEINHIPFAFDATDAF